MTKLNCKITWLLGPEPRVSVYRTETIIVTTVLIHHQTITNISVIIKIMYVIPLFAEHPSLNRQKQLNIIIKRHISGTKQWKRWQKTEYTYRISKGEVPRVFTMWKTITTLCKNPWWVYGILIIFSFSGFPVIMKFQPATCKTYLPTSG